MTFTIRPVIRFLGVGLTLMLFTVGLPTSIEARPDPTTPRSGGGGHQGTAREHGGTPAPRAATPSRPAAPARGQAPPHGTAPARGYPPPHGTAPARGYPPPGGTAHGVAHYGYGYGYDYPYWGYPFWGSGYGWWGAGWYGGWWGWPNDYRFLPYGPGYGPYPETYIAAVDAPTPSGPANVETGVTPSKAEVVLDGDTVGFASDYNGRWDQLSVAPGPHTIAFQQKGYRTLIVTFVARPGASYVFNDVLVSGEGEERRVLPEAVEPPQAPRPNAAPVAVGRLRVRAEPTDAAVYLDGEYIGLGGELSRIHAALAVATGSHHLEAVRPGYVSAARTVEVGDTDVVIVDLSLEPQR